MFINGAPETLFPLNLFLDAAGGQKTTTECKEYPREDSFVLIADNGIGGTTPGISFSPELARKYWEKNKEPGKQPPLEFKSAPVKNTTFDIGFPLVFQHGTTIRMEISREIRSYADEKPRSALVVRWVLSKPALGFYKIRAKFKLFSSGKFEDRLSYEVHKGDADLVVIPLWKVIKTSTAFSIVEMLLFEDEERPRLVLRSESKESKWGTWQQLKDEKMCKARSGFWLNKSAAYKEGWCKFWKVETIVNKMFFAYLEDHPVFSDKLKEMDASPDIYKKITIAAEIIGSILNTPYSAPRYGDDGKSDCWSKEDLNKMKVNALRSQSILNDELFPPVETTPRLPSLPFDQTQTP